MCRYVGVAVTTPCPSHLVSIPTISEDTAREALLLEVSKNCCYGKGAAQNLVFTNMVPSSAFHVSL